MLFLRVLGGLSLERDGVPVDAMAAQRKSLALLALLAVAGPRGMSRDALIAFVWPESDSERGRGALRQTLHAMRPRVGDVELLIGTSELRLNPEIVSSDVARFSDCLAREELADAVGAYGGPFLDGYHLSGAPTFEQWVAEQRSRLERDFGGALERLATEASARGAFADAVRWWHKLAATEPLNGRVAIGLMRALAAAGDSAAALRHASIHESLLREELDSAPDPAVVALAARLRAQPEASRAEPAVLPVNVSSASPAADSITVADPPRGVTRMSSSSTVFVLALLAMVSAFGVWWVFSPKAPDATKAKATRLLVAPFENLTGDARLDNVGRMAADRLALAAAQAGSMDVVPSMTVLMSMRDTTGGVAHRLERLSDATHAGLLVSGTVVLRGDSLVLQAQVTNVHTGMAVVTLDPATGSASDPIAIIDALSDHLLGALGNRDKGLSILPEGTRAPRYAAYQQLAAGFERFAVHSDNMGSRPFFERAIAIDSNYTRAYQMLGRQYLNAGEYARADTLARRIERLSLTATERLQLEYMKGELNGDIAAQLRAQQQLVARDSSPLALELAGETATWLLQPAVAIPALERAEPAYLLLGGGAVRGHTLNLTEAYHEAGAHDREVRKLLEHQAFFTDVDVFRGRELRAYAGLARGADALALALADTMLRSNRDSSGSVLLRIVEGEQEFRAHGDSSTALRLLALARTWMMEHRAQAPTRDRQFREGLVMLASGMADSAIARFTVVARDTTRIDAAGNLALAQLARGGRARAQAVADSLGALQRPWLHGENTFWRAAITGALGERDQAVQLLRQANREGRRMPDWHYAGALDALHGYAPFESLVRAKK